ncbi:hypothetical protein [Actinomadura parmotrematis]|uniref:DNRLRE domain-containing protein n=1 Tax=Actinomadura parmotrematis TaxID=2864039 RepID=A0ABS7FT23_9ACTN|nr:hypothetical protein [Actinomadura parmotrematis]MBW8483554.1 hypothetical protein [Actinomadura parmotrematis]
MRSRVRTTALGLSGALLAAPLLTVPAASARPSPAPSVRRGGPARTLAFTAARAGEAVLSVSPAAPGVSWDRKGAESAVVSIAVDGRHVTDLVVPSATAIPRTLGLGAVRRGRHRVTLRFAKGSAAAARVVTLGRPSVRVSQDPVLRFAPVVVGRTGLPNNDPYQNAYSDTPLVAWHETRPAATAGHRILEYSVIWSNEDGGTDTPALMARWGRTTDIEWVYRVEVDERWRRVPGSDVYQAPEHQTFHFTGAYEGDHPVLQTCTVNNNMCDAVTPGAPLRFLLDATATRPADRAREVIMDRNPWTYRITSQELVREGKIESPSSPATKAVGDPRSYLFAEFAKTTGAATGTGSVPGVALGVRLRSDPARLYRSDHDDHAVAIDRDGAVATTVELPLGTTLDDVASLEALRSPIGAGDNGAPATVTAVDRGFFLDAGYLPGTPSITWRGSVTLTPEKPSAVLWEHGNL